MRQFVRLSFCPGYISFETFYPKCIFRGFIIIVLLGSVRLIKVYFNKIRLGSDRFARLFDN